MDKDQDLWTAADWAKKLRQQAETSREYRYKLYDKVDLKGAGKILDVGCGTGAVTLDIAEYTDGHVTGVDNDAEKLEEARKALAEVPDVELVEGDALKLPFDDETFDLVLFSIVLVYIEDQQTAVNEMARVTKKGGAVLACIEPDYEGTISYPEDRFRPLMLRHMLENGIDTQTGRKLKGLFTRAGLMTEVGCDTESEFIFMKDDRKRLKAATESFWFMEKIMEEYGWSEEEIKEYQRGVVERIQSGESFHFSVSFYAVGKKG